MTEVAHTIKQTLKQPNSRISELTKQHDSI